MSTIKNYPFYMRATFVLLALVLTAVILYLVQHIIFPVLWAMLFSILLSPLVARFNKKLRFPYALAVAVSVILNIVVISGIVFFVSWQIGDIANDWVKINNNLSIHYHNIQYYFRKKSTEKKEPKQRRKYISVNRELLDAMDDHIEKQIYKADYERIINKFNRQCRNYNKFIYRCVNEFNFDTHLYFFVPFV